MGKKDKDEDKEKSKKKEKKKDSKDSGSQKKIKTKDAPASAPSDGAGDVPAHKKPSSFRAVNSTNDQSVTPNDLVKMMFPSKQFDLASEYDTETSTFIPATNGVYVVLTNLNFIPSDPNGDYRTGLEIRVNGNQAATIENDFFGGDSRNMIAISTILQLQAGDQVEIFAKSNVSGTFIASGNGLRFEAARFSS